MLLKNTQNKMILLLNDYFVWWLYQNQKIWHGEGGENKINLSTICVSHNYIRLQILNW